MVLDVFRASARFFARPQDQKDSLRWISPQSNRGYVAPGREKLARYDDDGDMQSKRSDNPDIKESMEIGREYDDDVEKKNAPNRWPDQFDDEGKRFKQVMQTFFRACKGLHEQIMRAIALGMNLPVSFFDEFVDAGDNNLRLLHYPPVAKEAFRANPDQVRAGEHSDYGSVTLLFQDAHGGLQVRSPKGTFVNATPIPDTIVVNAGDLLARWSNDAIKSTQHRVVEPPPAAPAAVAAGGPGGGVGYVNGSDSDTYPARYSVAYFCNPNSDKFIEALPGTYGEDIGVPKKYSGIHAGEYIMQRLAATY